LPLRTLSSSVRRDVEFELRAPTLDPSGVPDLSDVTRFTQLRWEFKSVPLGFSFVARTPRLPKFRDAFVDRVLATGVALQPGRGAVPLGVGTALNVQPADDQLDAKGALASSQFAVRMAPRHHGLEGASYALVTQARSTAFPALGRASSTLVTRVPQDLLFFDPKGSEHPLDQSMSAFLSLPEDGRLALATRHFTLSARTDATVVRVTFTRADGAKWDVLVDPTMPEFKLPVPPGLADRLPDAQVTVQTQRYDEPVTSDRLVQFAEWAARPQLHDPLRFLTAWASVEAFPRAVKFTEPSTPGRTLSAGATLSIAVQGAHLGPRANDHLLAVRFTNGLQCPDVVASEEISPGLVQVTLPQACRGVGLVIDAELIDQQRQPLAPAVSTRTIVTVQ
jgi:hypothetical protein